MKVNRFVLSLMVLLALNACKREPYPQPVVSQPEFTMSGLLDGQSFALQAGTNNLYLSSTLNQNEFGVYQFVSEFNSTICSTCEPIFSVAINDAEQLDSGASTSAAILNQGLLSFATIGNNSNFLIVNFDAPDVPGGNYNWNFGDGNTSQLHEPQHEFAAPGVYTVILNVYSTGGPGCDVTLAQTILAGSNKLLARPFILQDGPGNSIFLSFPSNLPPDLQVLNWTINGNNFQGNNLQYNIPPGPNPVEICLNFYNNQAQEYGQYCLTYDDGPGGNDMPCLTQMHYQFEPAQVNLSNVRLTYRNQAGVVYSSITPLNNNSNTNFEITAVNDYAPGIDGYPVKKVTALFNAWLVNESNPTETIYMENMKADLAFRY